MFLNINAYSCFSSQNDEVVRNFTIVVPWWYSGDRNKTVRLMRTVS